MSGTYKNEGKKTNKTNKEGGTKPESGTITGVALNDILNPQHYRLNQRVLAI